MHQIIKFRILHIKSVYHHIEYLSPSRIWCATTLPHICFLATSPVLLCNHVMMASSNGNIFRVTGPLRGKFTGEFPSQWPVTRSFGVFFDLRLNKRLGKQSWGWWFETPSCSFWHHCNVIACTVPLHVILWLTMVWFVCHSTQVHSTTLHEHATSQWHNDILHYISNSST